MRNFRHWSAGEYLVAGLLTGLLILAAGCNAGPRILVLDDPLSPEEHVKLALAYETQGELDLAAKEYQAAAEKMPKARLSLADVQNRMGDHENAEKNYRLAMAALPGDPAPMHSLAKLLCSRGQRLVEAEQLAKAALAAAPEEDSKQYLETLLIIQRFRFGMGNGCAAPAVIPKK
jgi:Tfp pilus assembly protein PilF